MSSQSKPDSKRSAREKAAEARALAEAAERRRDRTIRIIGAIVVLAVVVGVVLIGLLGHKKSAAPKVNPNAALPKGVSSTNYGVPVGNSPKTAPRLDVWEDFQCPICKELQVANGAGLNALATSGKVQLYWHPATFIEDKFPNSNQSSTRATYAWGCAIDAGYTQQYHDAVFAIQSATEGAGFTDQQLLDLAKRVGITGAAYDTFSQCYANAKYKQWAINSEAVFTTNQLPGTPYATLNGKPLDNNVLASPSGLAAAVASAGPAPSKS